MPEVYPFRGFRYATSVVGELSRLVTQPYDKISAEARERYLASSDANVAHVISNPDYQDAGARFASWIRAGVLVQDPEPAFYIYRQSFQISGQRLQRTGAIGLLDLRSSEAGVLRHEKVMDAPLQDRLSLISATESNDGLIFMLLDDPASSWEETLDRVLDQLQPEAETRDEFHVLNQLWRIVDPRAIEVLQAFLRQEKLYIADGHHRFETAIRFAQNCSARNWKPAAVESFDKRMIALFSSRSPGVVILPTHRAIRGLELSRVENLLARLEQNFDVEPYPDPSLLGQTLKGCSDSIGLLLGPEPKAFLIRDPDARSKLPAELTASARELDVNLLHKGILEPLLGIGEPELASQKHVDYYRHQEELLEGLRSNRYQMAFLLNPTSTDQVRRVSEDGERMPQKSTDFFPKLLTGLVFMKMEIDRNDEKVVGAGSSS